MRQTGRLLAVEETVVGSRAAAAAIIGASALLVDDPDWFAPAGLLRHVGAADVIYGYDGVADDGTITLTSPLIQAVTEDDVVRAEPIALVREAHVALEDASDTAVVARVPHAMAPWVRPGVAAADDQDVIVLEETSPGDWLVVDLLGRATSRIGYDVIDWRNDDGIPLIGGDEGAGVPAAVFGAGTEHAEFSAFNRGPVDTSLGAAGSGVLRRVGESGAGAGGVKLTLEQPTKVKVDAHASVINATGFGFNVKFFIVAHIIATGAMIAGEPGTQWCEPNDLGLNRHRQVARHREIAFPNASRSAPVELYLWWGFQQDNPNARDVQIRNMAMSIRLNYAPGLPSTAVPDAAPVWANADLAARYVMAETDDVI